ncbi:MAG: hypothetical protein ABSB26_09985 [Nitrososphaerales archaeon]
MKTEPAHNGSSPTDGDIFPSLGKSYGAGLKPSQQEVLARVVQIRKSEKREVCARDISDYESTSSKARLKPKTVQNALSSLTKQGLLRRVSQGWYMPTQEGTATGEERPRGGKATLDFGSLIRDAALHSPEMARQFHSLNLEFEVEDLYERVESQTGWESISQARSCIHRERWEMRTVTIQVQHNPPGSTLNTVNVQVTCTQPEQVLRTDSISFLCLTDYLGGIRAYLESLGVEVPPSPDWWIVQIHLGVDCQTEMRLEGGICVTLREAQETFRVYSKTPELIRFEVARDHVKEPLKGFAEREIGFKELALERLQRNATALQALDRRQSAIEERLATLETIARVNLDQNGSLIETMTRLVKTVEASSV